MEHLFTEADQDRILEAVRTAEERTAGEIVPVVVARSARYDLAVWRGASILAIVSLAVVLLIFQFYAGWGLGWLHTGWGTALVTLIAGTVGALVAAYVPPVKRLLSGGAYMTRRVHQRAMQAFVEEEVFATRDRTGILLFISLFEHRIEVVGDTGINRLVEEDEWADVVTVIRDGIRSGRPADGLVEAIGLCGRLLEKRGVDVRDDDENELPNRLRLPKDR